MPKYDTYLQAIDPKDGILKKYGGQIIEAESQEKAQEYLDTNGLGYLVLNGEIIHEEFTDIVKSFKEFEFKD